MFFLNPFTVHVFLGLLVSAPLAAVLYVLYFRQGRPVVELLLANLMTLGAGLCVLALWSDNLIPAGMNALGWPGGPTAEQLAQRTAGILRWNWLIGAWVMATQIHFVAAYAIPTGWVARRAWVLYLLAGAISPVVFSGLFVTPAAAPLASTSSWRVVLPWMPAIGPGATPYLAIWTGVQVWTLTAIWRRGRRAGRQRPGLTRHWRFIFAGLVGQAAIGVADIALAATGYAGIALSPLAVVLMGTLMAAGLLRERAKAEAAVRRLHRRLNHELLGAREQERRRLAGELHDSLAQSLVAMQLALRAARQGETPASPAVLEDLEHRCRNLVAETRGLCHGLYPPSLEALGLSATIGRTLQYCRSVGMDARLQCSPADAARRFEPAVEIAVFRIVQEAIANAMKHSRARSITVELAYRRGVLAVSVGDDGVGFNVDEAMGRGLGMATIRSRAEAAGGQARIDSSRGGTRVRVEIPCRAIHSGGGEARCNKDCTVLRADEQWNR